MQMSLVTFILQKSKGLKYKIYTDKTSEET